MLNVASFVDHQHSVSFSNSEQEDLLKVSRNISSACDMYGSVGSHYSKRNMRQSNLWNSYSNESAGSMLESPSSSVDSLDPSSPRQRPSTTDSSGGGSFYVTMVPLKSGSKVSVSITRGKHSVDTFFFLSLSVFFYCCRFIVANATKKTTKT